MEYVNASGCKVYMDPYMASDGSCFMVTWIIFKNHLLVHVGLTQDREAMTHNRWFIPILSCVRIRTNRNSLK
jgi:hypothetical protein